MIILPELPQTRQALLERIGEIETARERQRSLGRLSPERARQIARELSELRQALAVAIVQEAAS